MENQLVDNNNIILLEKNNIRLIRVEHKDEFEIFDVERNISFKVSKIFAMSFLKFQHSVNFISSIEERHNFFRCFNRTSEELYNLAFLLICMISFSIPLMMMINKPLGLSKLVYEDKHIVFNFFTFNIFLASIMSINIQFPYFPEDSFCRFIFGLYTFSIIFWQLFAMGVVLMYFQIEFNYSTFIIPSLIIAIYFGILICFIFIDLQKVSKVILIIFSLISVAILECVLYMTGVLKLDEVLMLLGGSLLMIWIMVSSFLFFFCEIYCKNKEIFMFSKFHYCTIFYPIFFFFGFLIYTIPLLILSVFKRSLFHAWNDITYKGFILSIFYFRHMISLK